MSHVPRRRPLLYSYGCIQALVRRTYHLVQPFVVDHRDVPLSTAFLYFFVLTIFAIVHQKEDTRIWHTGVRDFPWFNTKLCLGSAPSSPMQSSHRLAKPKLPSLAAPKPRRPPPIFVAQRAGLGSNIEIEHFPDPGSLEEAPLPALPSVSQVPTSVSLYPHHVQASVRQTPSYQPPNNTYYPSRIGPGSSPPPIRDWPRPLASTNTHASSSSSHNREPQPQPQMSDRAVGKQRALVDQVKCVNVHILGKEQLGECLLIPKLDLIHICAFTGCF